MARAHRYNHPPARTQLLDQCRRNIRRSSRHHDRVEWRQLRPAEPAIAGAKSRHWYSHRPPAQQPHCGPVPGSSRWSIPCRPARRAPPPDSRSRCRPPTRCRPVPGRAVRSSRRRRRAARSSGRDRSAGAHWRRPHPPSVAARMQHAAPWRAPPQPAETSCARPVQRAVARISASISASSAARSSIPELYRPCIAWFQPHGLARPVRRGIAFEAERSEDRSDGCA